MFPSFRNDASFGSGCFFCSLHGDKRELHGISLTIVLKRSIFRFIAPNQSKSQKFCAKFLKEISSLVNDGGFHTKQSFEGRHLANDMSRQKRRKGMKSSKFEDVKILDLFMSGAYCTVRTHALCPTTCLVIAFGSFT